jgi:hypothetical protein
MLIFLTVKIKLEQTIGYIFRNNLVLVIYFYDLK